MSNSKLTLTESILKQQTQLEDYERNIKNIQIQLEKFSKQLEEKDESITETTTALEQSVETIQELTPELEELSQILNQVNIDQIKHLNSSLSQQIQQLQSQIQQFTSQDINHLNRSMSTVIEQINTKLTTLNQFKIKLTPESVESEFLSTVKQATEQALPQLKTQIENKVQEEVQARILNQKTIWIAVMSFIFLIVTVLINIWLLFNVRTNLKQIEIQKNDISHYAEVLKSQEVQMQNQAIYLEQTKHKRK